MWSRVRLWWAARATDPELSDDELETSTRRLAKAITQTLDNRSFSRPSLAADAPRESAVEQRAFDRETVEKYRESIAPEFDSIREEYVARGMWTADLDELVQDPAGTADLRRLVIRLDDLASDLDASG